ncbi:MAG: 30S ribosomal protein S2, partial [Candidatus Thermoplasmatota archaeon]|nr:30S ribosomal protein S2 [Candidatus Thermoplasmatota archaeon]
MSDDVALLVPFSEYEENAVNIGTQQKSADMARFIQTVRDDGLYLLDVASTDQRIRLVAQFLCRYEPGRVMVVSARQVGQRPARLVAEAHGANPTVGGVKPR